MQMNLSQAPSLLGGSPLDWLGLLTNFLSPSQPQPGPQVVVVPSQASPYVMPLALGAVAVVGVVLLLKKKRRA